MHEAPLPFREDFSVDRRRGTVVGSPSTGSAPSVPRAGADVEGLLGVDGGALRIPPLARPGWGRTAVAYGPYQRRPGLGVAISLLNSHHASEHVEPWPPLATYLKQVLRGTQVDALPHRAAHRPRHHARETLARRVRSWFGHRRAAGAPDADVNLAVGWLGGPAPTSPTGGGQGLLVRSAHGENGELVAEVGGGRATTQERLLNLPLHVLVVARERGATYWAGSLEGALGLPAAPTLRPLALDAAGDAGELWAGVHQQVAGQVGWSIDSRVRELAVARPDPWAAWWTTAHAADRPAGGAPRHGAEAAMGGRWAVAGGVALLQPAQPAGLVRARARGDGVGLVSRAVGPDDHLVLRLADGAVALTLVEAGVARDLAAGPLPEAAGAGRELQLVDDGCTVRALVDGRLALGPVVVGPAPGHGVGVLLTETDADADAVAVDEVEAHPLHLRLPDELSLAVPPVPCGRRVVLDEDFAAGDEPPADLAGRPTRAGSQWQRTIGARPFLVDGGGVLVPPPAAPGPARRRGRGRLSALTAPGGERLAYTVPWPEPSLADLTVRIAPPGTERHQGHGSRAGLVFWQDPDTYLMVNTWLDDAYDGTSISSFLRVAGYEDVFDAVWANVGRRVTWGRPFDLRTSFDGDLHTTWVDGEPVLQRRARDVLPRVAPFRVNRVGLLANWEFGQDTGSRFLSLRGLA